MKLSSLEVILSALNEAGVEYLVAGGVAVNAYGYQRLTQDLDLVVGLAQDNTRRALDVLSALGYRPMVPVDIHDFEDAAHRQRWITERNMEVFSLASDRYPETEVDLFASEPFDFAEELKAAEVYEIGRGIRLPLVRLTSLISMKERTGRSSDADDVRHLRWVLEERGGPDQ